MSGELRALGAGCLWLLALTAVLITQLRVTADITHFLPADADREDVLLARQLATGELSRTLVLLVDAPDSATAANASHAFEAELQRDPVIRDGLTSLVAGPLPDFEESLWQLYQPHRCAFVAADAATARARVTATALESAVDDLKRKLNSPMSTFLSKAAPSDPLLILPQLFDRLMDRSERGLQLIAGRFVTGDGHGAVLFATTRPASSNATAVRPVIDAIEAAFARVNADFEDQLELQQSGTHRFALAAEASMRSDIQRVGLGSGIGLLALFLLVFRSLRLLLLVLPVLTAGFLTGTTACLWCFGSVHGLTLAFGAALIGVSVDYGVHFYCHHRYAAPQLASRRTLRAIWPGLALGAATTITGFAVLMVSTFPGLRQLAVFAAFGIAGAALSTQLFLPALAGKSPPPASVTTALLRRLHRLLFEPRPRRWPLLLPAIATALLAAVGLPQLRWNDRLGDLNRIDPALLAADEAVRERVARFEQRRLVVAVGADDETALRANDRVAAALRDLQANGAVGGWRGIWPLLPSAERQRDVDAAIRSDADVWPRLTTALTAAQFHVDAFVPWREHLAAPPPPPLTYDDIGNSALAPLVRPFRFEWEGGVGFVSFLRDLHDEPALRAALSAIAGAKLIDIESTLSSAYGAYRERLLQLWLLGLGAVLLLVALRHRAWRPTLIAYVPAMLAAAGTVGLLALIGLELNMLSLVALLMVVSMGVDYGVFLAEHHRDATRRDATALAVLLAGLSTMLGFGLLSLSAEPPLFHIGLTSGIGVLLCLVVAPSFCAFTTNSTRP